MNTDIEDDEDTVTLGVSAVLCHHGAVYPDPVGSGSDLHRATHPGDASTSSRCPDETSSEHSADFGQQHLRPAVVRPASSCRRQSPNTETTHIHRCGLLYLLGSVRGSNSHPDVGELVQSAVWSPVRRDVAGERQQRRQRVHLLVHQRAVPAPLRPADVQSLLFQIVPPEYEPAMSTRSHAATCPVFRLYRRHQEMFFPAHTLLRPTSLFGFPLCFILGQL